MAKRTNPPSPTRSANWLANDLTGAAPGETLRRRRAHSGSGRLTRAVFMIPNVLGWTALSILFMFIYLPDAGIAAGAINE